MSCNVFGSWHAGSLRIIITTTPKQGKALALSTSLVNDDENDITMESIARSCRCDVRFVVRCVLALAFVLSFHHVRLASLAPTTFPFLAADGTDALYLSHSRYINQSNKAINLQQEKTPLRSNATAISSSSSPSSASLVSSSFSICLLMKDDNDILPEWIAYHYHSLQLRHLIVAIDPYSTTSPLFILERFALHLPDFTYTMWSDNDYMPPWFVQYNSSSIKDRFYDNRVPKLVPQFWFLNSSTSPFHQNLQDEGNNITKQQLQHDYQMINEYWFRQRTFVTQCVHALRRRFLVKRGQGGNSSKNKSSDSSPSAKNITKWPSLPDYTFMAHIDTDEYITMNPLLRTRNGSLSTMIEPYRRKGITESSILHVLHDMLYHQLIELKKHRLVPSCVVVPTILYGSVEANKSNGGAPSVGEGTIAETMRNTLNVQQWESIRWFHHAGWDDYSVNGYPKVIMDIRSLVSKNDSMLHEPYVFNPHQPSKTSCKRMTMYNNFNSVKLHPLALHHYIGSWERYNSRNDTRRNRAVS